MRNKKLRRPGRLSALPWDELISIGRCTKPHGIKGELKVTILTDFPERFLQTERVHLHCLEPPVYELNVESARLHGGGALLKLEAVNSIEVAELFRGYFLGITEDELAPLEEDEYWHFELEGLEARTREGKRLGQLKEVLSTPGHDLYAIATEDEQELLIPAVREYVTEINLEEGYLTVRVPEVE